MKNSFKIGITILIMLSMFPFIHTYAQVNNNAKNEYQGKWDLIREYEENRSYNSALILVNEIFKNAKKVNDQCLEVKCIIKIALYEKNLNGYDETKAIAFLEEQLKTTKFPVTSIVYSILAEYFYDRLFLKEYGSYYTRNLAKYDPKDISTWTLGSYRDTIITLLKESIQPENELQKIPINQFLCTVDKGNMDEDIRPTLFDFLVHNAIKCLNHYEGFGFTNDFYEMRVNKKNLIGTKLMVPLDDFLKISNTYDPDIQMDQNFQYLNRLLKFHLTDVNQNALGYVDLERLEFVYNQYDFPNKNKLYFDNLQLIAEQYKNYPVYSEIIYRQAGLIDNGGYRPTGIDSNVFLHALALEYCQKAIDKYPNSTGTDKCKVLKSKILMKSLSSNVENLIPSNKPVQLLINYRNIDEFYLRISLIDDKTRDLLDTFRQSDSAKIVCLGSLIPVFKKYYKLPLPDDHILHHAEVPVPALQYGYYVCMVSNRPDFKYDSNNIAYTYFTVSDLRAITIKQIYDSVQKLYVVDATSGQPVEGVNVKLIFRDYDYNFIDSTGSSSIDTTHATTDAKGYAEFIYPKTYDHLPEYTLRKGNDFVRINTILPHGNDKKNMKDTIICFFTDRSIYRPGQTVFFKGIISGCNADGTILEAVKNYQTTIRITGPYYGQEIININVRTNEFGSFSGSYNLPLNSNTGEYKLVTQGYHSDDDYSFYDWRPYGFYNDMVSEHYEHNSFQNGYRSFYVEEYKRPKFELNLKPIAKAYRLNDSVIVTGNAMSFSGVSVSNAKVIYSVIRNANFIYYPDYHYSYENKDRLIKGDTVLTDNEGNFSLKFVTLPDTIIPDSVKPIFNYEINVSVTDINNETHETSTTVNAGYVAMKAEMDPGNWNSVNKNLDLVIKTTNLNGASVKVKGKISIYRFRQNEKPIREKFWKSPDQFIISKNEYSVLFPLDPYTENETVNLKVQDILYGFYSGFTQEDNSSLNIHKPKDLVLTLPVSSNENTQLLSKKLFKLGPGEYELVFEAKDSFGADLKTTATTTLYDEKSTKSAFNEFSYFIPVATNVEPGSNAKFIWGSADQANAIYFIEQNGKVTRSGSVKVSGQQKLIEIPIVEADRGNVYISLMCIIHNRFFSYYEMIKVPWSNKKLYIRLTTFRSVLETGINEKWSLKITGSDKYAPKAEVMAGMYDASLDVLMPNEWIMDLYPRFHRYSWFSYNAPNEDIYSHNSGQRCKKYYSGINWRFNDLMKEFNKFNDNNAYTENLACDTLPTDYDLMAMKEYYEREINYVPIYESIFLTSGSSEESVQMADPNSGGVNDPVKNNPSFYNIRRSLKETAFFLPQLKTDPNGDITFEFITPETLTRWKLMILTHTQDLKTGYLQESVITQRKLMITTNNPRFFRAGDEINLAAKLSNLTDSSLKGTIYIRLLDPYSMKPIDSLFKLVDNDFNFNLDKQSSKSYSWKFKVPESIDAVTCQVIANSEKYSDGEENTIPVLPNKILITESIPLFVKQGQVKNFKFDKLINSNNASSTLQNRSLTLEVTPNPAWYAVMSLPYIMESQYECSDDVFNRFYANNISYYLANSNPDIKKVFEKWKNTPALLSPLEKNQDLKSILLSETPWLMDAKNENEQRKKAGILFDDSLVSVALKETFKKLINLQTDEGGWPWFKGMPARWYITQYIVSGLGHLKQMGIKPIVNMSDPNQVNISETIDQQDSIPKYDYIAAMQKRAIDFMDTMLVRDWKIEKKKSVIYLGYEEIQYFYARSFFPEIKIPDQSLEAYNFWKNQLAMQWKNRSLSSKLMIALSLNRIGNTKVSKDIMKSIKDSALYSEEDGMYWKENQPSWFAGRNPVQTQALLIEAFSEISHDNESVDKMKIWLLKQKRTNFWNTTSATADACYALLLMGHDFLTTKNETRVWMADTEINAPKDQQEAGTGYYSIKWNGNEVKTQYGNIKMEKKDKGISWGAVHWQYLEYIDKLSPSVNPLKIDKQVYLVKNEFNEEKLIPITENQILKIGDKIRIKLILTSDREMSFIYLKDMHASSLEPEEVFSGYEYSNGISYYKSIRDASFNYFIEELYPGTSVFNYTLVINQEGTFQNGIATVQCMYAPEFNSHSAGMILKSIK